MTDRCPHLDYRRSAGDREFETERAYCTVVDRFVQPMRADVCNARYDLSPTQHCEFYREREGIEDPWLTGDGVGRETNGSGNDDTGDGRTGEGGDEGSNADGGPGHDDGVGTERGDVETEHGGVGTGDDAGENGDP